MKNRSEVATPDVINDESHLELLKNRRKSKAELATSRRSRIYGEPISRVQKTINPFFLSVRADDCRRKMERQGMNKDYLIWHVFLPDYITALHLHVTNE